MNDKMKKSLEDFQRRAPKTFAACYPRHINVPGGYANPKFFARVLGHELAVATVDEMRMLPHLTGILHCFKHLEMGVPTYFVRSEFAQAVAQTNPPSDFRLSEIHWPLDAMLFVLPTSFAVQYFGYMVPFISICRAPAGMYPDIVKLPELNALPYPLKQLNNFSERFLVVAPLYRKQADAIDYTCAFNMTQTIGELASLPYEDASYFEEQVMKIDISKMPDEPTGEADRIFHDKMILFAFKLMLAITARPGVIKHGQITRPARVIKCRHPKVRDAIWSHNTVGWDYRAVRPASVSGNGSHVSPRMHWRGGHFHTILLGPRDQERQRRLDWFEPCLVNAPKT
jgi:hypothetical protein